MKIAVVINELNVRGGTHKQVLRLCQYLSQKHKEFLIITRYWEPNKIYSEFRQFDIRFLYDHVPEKKKHRSLFGKVVNKIDNYKEDKRLYALIPEDVDIVNPHDNCLNTIIRLAKKNGKKVVWQINDLPGCFNVGVACKEQDNYKKKIHRIVTRFNTKETDVITVNVTKNAQRVKQCLGKDASVLYCGVDVNHSLIKHSFKKDNQEFRLLSMGVFFPYRNYETLVAVIKNLCDQGKRIRLDIIGTVDLDRDYYKKIANLIKENKLENVIKIWGQVDDETYAKLFNEADAFAFINIEQSWGLAVFEAMSAGLPTIVSNSVGAIELLHNDKDAIILDPKDVDAIAFVITRLMTDEKYYNRLSDEAARVVKDFTWEKLYSSKMLEIFEELEKSK